MKPFDCHCHLDDKAFDKDRQEVINEVLRELSGLINCGTDAKSNKFSLELAKQYAKIYAALGLHPTVIINMPASEIESQIGKIEKFLADKNVVAIGEVGLDFAWIKKRKNFEELKKKQEKYFLKFIEISKEYEMPLIIHSRWAAEKVLSLLLEARAEKVMLHAFNTSLKTATLAIENGFYISIGTNVLYADYMQRFASNLPLENILLETDSPYMLRVKKNNEWVLERNEPKNILLAVEKISQLRNLSQAEIIKKTNLNVDKLFKIT